MNLTAVRADPFTDAQILYLRIPAATAMADLAYHNGDKELLDSCKSLWDNITNKQIYINGSIGSTPSGEAFTKDYDLPNDTNYSETCAALGMIFFTFKMLQNFEQS